MNEYVARRGSARLPIRAGVKVRYPGVEDVFEEVTGNLGMSGMFVHCDSPMPPGTLMHFELRPAENWRLLKGRGRVVWARQIPEQDEPTGMGVQFVELEERARRAIRWVIETHQEDESRPFDTWTVPEQFARSQPLPEAADLLATQEIPPLAEENRSGIGWTIPLAALAIALLLGWFGWRTFFPADDAAGPVTSAQVGGPSPDSVTPEAAQIPTPASNQPLDVDEEVGEGALTPAPIDEPGVAAPDPDPTQSATESPEADIETGSSPADSAADTSPSVPPSEALAETLRQRARDWAGAWSSQDPDAYLSFYSEGFQPAEGLSNQAWRAQRRDRLTGPEFIEVVLSDLEVIDADSDRPTTVFSQRYRSNTFQDQVTKSLTWERIDGAWRIISERSTP